MPSNLLEISDLRVGFLIEGDVIAEAVGGVSISIQAGETLGLVGESGSGKSVTGLAVMGLIQSPGRILGGEIRFDGKDLLVLPEQEMRNIRGSEISMIFQEPLTALNPAFTIGQQLIDVIRTHQKVKGKIARERAIETLALVGIPSPAQRLASYPHQFSGGMRQRVLIAMAVSCRPKLLIADEPTTALDVTVQAQIIALLSQIRYELGLTILFITHNLDLVAEVCDRVVVMYAGRVMEEAPVESLFTAPLHPYTRALKRCVPRLVGPSSQLETIKGIPPALGEAVLGCLFRPRCSDASERCRDDYPTEVNINGHRVSCWMVESHRFG